MANINIVTVYKRRPRYDTIKLGDKLKIKGVAEHFTVTDMRPCASYKRGLCFALTSMPACVFKGTFIEVLAEGSVFFHTTICARCITDLDGNVYR